MIKIEATISEDKRGVVQVDVRAIKHPPVTEHEMRNALDTWATLRTAFETVHQRDPTLAKTIIVEHRHAGFGKIESLPNEPGP